MDKFNLFSAINTCKIGIYRMANYNFQDVAITDSNVNRMMILDMFSRLDKVKNKVDMDNVKSIYNKLKEFVDVYDVRKQLDIKFENIVNNDFGLNISDDTICNINVMNICNHLSNVECSINKENLLTLYNKLKWLN